MFLWTLVLQDIGGQYMKEGLGFETDFYLNPGAFVRLSKEAPPHLSSGTYFPWIIIFKDHLKVPVLPRTYFETHFSTQMKPHILTFSLYGNF